MHNHGGGRRGGSIIICALAARFRRRDINAMASSGDEEPPKAHGEAAHKALRKHFPALMKVVASGDIVENLYAEEIIDESTFEVVTTPGTLLSNKQKGTRILKDVQVSVSSKPKAFETFCQFLKSEGHTDIVLRLRGIPGLSACSLMIL